MTTRQGEYSEYRTICFWKMEWQRFAICQVGPRHSLSRGRKGKKSQPGPPSLTSECTKSSVSNPTIPSGGKRDSAFKVAIKSRKSPLNQFRRSIFINRAYRSGCKLKAEPKRFSPTPPKRKRTEILENYKGRNTNRKKTKREFNIVIIVMSELCWQLLPCFYCLSKWWLPNSDNLSTNPLPVFDFAAVSHRDKV